MTIHVSAFPTAVFAPADGLIRFRDNGFSEEVDIYLSQLPPKALRAIAKALTAEADRRDPPPEDVL